MADVRSRTSTWGIKLSQIRPEGGPGALSCARTVGERPVAFDYVVNDGIVARRDRKVR